MNEKNTFDADILVALFHRTGGHHSSLVKAFNDFSDDIKYFVLKTITLDLNEEVALLSFMNEDNWVLVTTQRLIWCRDKALDEIINEDLEEVTIDRQSLQRIGPQYKRQTKDLKIVTKSRGLCTIELADSGEFFWAFLNAVKWICRRNFRFL